MDSVKLKAQNPPSVKLVAGGTVVVEGTIPITENGITNVAQYEFADVNIKTYEQEYQQALAEIELDNGYFSDISEAIVNKDGGDPPAENEMAQRIEALPVAEPVVQNPVLALMDWEGTILKEYTKEQALTLTELPNPSTFSKYADVDHELLSFQEWNWSLADIKTFVQNKPNEKLIIGAIYTTTDNQDHNYWNNPRLENTAKAIYKQKRKTTSIGGSAFANCYSLTCINIPDGVTSIGASSFGNCCSLKSINIPDGVTSIGAGAFGSCYSLKSINIPDGVTSIENSAFNGCYSLTSINIPDGVTSIGNTAFANCRALTSINIPDSVTSIGIGVFDNCRSFTSINIPDGVTSIGNSTFSNCSYLIDVVIQGKPSLLNTNAFGSTHSNLRIYVPRDYLSWYETETNWSTLYANNKIVAIEDYISYLESIGIDVSEYEEVA